VNYAGQDTIYEFDRNGRLLVKHVIDFGNLHRPIEKARDEKVAFEIRSNPKYASNDLFFYSKDYSLLTYSFERRARFLLRNNKTGKSLDASSLENDMSFISLAAPIKIHENKIFYIREAHFVMGQKHDNKPAYLNIPALSSLKEDDNQVIMIGYLNF
jgi:hypothetical protein